MAKIDQWKLMIPDSDKYLLHTVSWLDEEEYIITKHNTYEVHDDDTVELIMQILLKDGSNGKRRAKVYDMRHNGVLLFDKEMDMSGIIKAISKELQNEN